jgi:uncharacterized protein YuzE
MEYKDINIILKPCNNGDIVGDCLNLSETDFAMNNSNKLNDDSNKQVDISLDIHHDVVEQISINYDKETDTIYISFGQPRPSYGEEDTPGIVVLRDLENDEITGITMLDFQKKLEKHPIGKLLLEYMQNTLNI